jgi:hypothetical protein
MDQLTPQDIERVKSQDGILCENLYPKPCNNFNPFICYACDWYKKASRDLGSVNRVLSGNFDS